MTSSEFHRAAVVAARGRAMRLARAVRPYDYDHVAKILADGFAALGIEVDAPVVAGAQCLTAFAPKQSAASTPLEQKQK